jgi:formylglycine-generating enzyme required for sulfatase activity
MLIQTPSIIVLSLILNAMPSPAVLFAQDASGRDPGGKPATKKAPPPVSTPKPVPKATPAAPKVSAKAPAKVATKTKAAKSPEAVKTVPPKKTATVPVKTATPAPPAAVTTSRLTLTAVPNARIELAGRGSATTNADGKIVLTDVPFGSYALAVNADGYEPWSGTVEVKTAATDFAVALKKRVTTGTLAITVNQPGAEVFINEKINLKTVAGQQITVEGLLPGTHQIRVAKPGYKEWRGVVPVSVGEIRRVEVSMSVGVSPEMVRVPAGEFLMGNDRGPKDSSPAHQVVLGEFEISRREMSNRFYKSFIEATGHPAPNPQASGWQGNNYPADKADAPVTGISWEDATAFCKWLSQEGGTTYRLPTEAEWERAARTVGNVYQSISVVWEWCQDWYDAEYYKRKDRLSPQGPALRPAPSNDPKIPQGRVIRGGSASSAGRAVRVFERNAAQPTQGRGDIGFRVVREVVNR